MPAWCHNDDFWNCLLDFKSKIKTCWTNRPNCCVSTSMQHKPQYCHKSFTVPETPLIWRCATKLLWPGQRPHNLTSHAELPHGPFMTWLIVSSHLLPILCSYWLPTSKSIWQCPIVSSLLRYGTLFQVEWPYELIWLV